MRVCIFGAGAIGGLLGARLADAGADVSLVDRGPHLAAIQENGLELRTANGSIRTKPNAVSDSGDLGPQDCVFIALKAHSVTPALPAIIPLLGPETFVVWGVNGLPWWYFHGLDGPLRDRRIQAADPGGQQWKQIGPRRVLGCVVYPAAEVESPGVVRLIEGDRFSLGELDGSRSQRASAFAQALVSAGFRAPVRSRIRDEIWVKLWGNISFNPISVLTTATLDVIAEDPETRAIARAMMLEARAIGEKLGVRFSIDVDERIAGAGAVGAHKTSMLQDLEKDRPMEIGVLVDAVRELGRLVGLPTPTIDIVAGLVRQRALIAGCIPDPS